jgi:hypothetical protein
VLFRSRLPLYGRHKSKLTADTSEILITQLPDKTAAKFERLLCFLGPVNCSKAIINPILDNRSGIFKMAANKPELL